MDRVLALTTLAASLVLAAAPAMAGNFTAVPEPASLTLLGVGIAAVGIVNLIRQRKK